MGKRLCTEGIKKKEIIIACCLIVDISFQKSMITNKNQNYFSILCNIHLYADSPIRIIVIVLLNIIHTTDFQKSRSYIQIHVICSKGYKIIMNYSHKF